MEPVLIERACGGWLALSPDNCRWRFGVTADTEAEARRKFTQSLARWMRTDSRAATCQGGYSMIDALAYSADITGQQP